MKIHISFLLCATTVLSSVLCDDECKRPEALKLKEEYCWTAEVEIVDRVVQRSRSVFNLAKKKLGIFVEDENETKKCEYYMCILRQLRMLNANDYPAYENIKAWTEKNVIYFQAIGLVEQLDKCQDALINSTVREVNFKADQVNNEKTQYDDNTELKSKEQNTCDIAAEFIDCLSRQKECPVFQYP